MAYERGSGDLVKSCSRICEILETGANRAEHSGLNRYLPKSPWVRAIAYKAGVPQGYAVYLTSQERQELRYLYGKVNGSMRGANRKAKLSLVEKLISSAYETRRKR